MNLNIELDREADGRWIADIPTLPGVMVYGESQPEAIKKVQILALHVIADLIESGDFAPIENVAFVSSQAA